MDYKLSKLEKFFSFFGYAILDIDKFKALAMSYQREKIYNEALRTSGKALLQSLNEVMAMKEQFPPELDYALADIYEETNRALDKLTTEMIRIYTAYGVKLENENDTAD